MTFLEYSKTLWGDEWTVCRKTKKNPMRYGKCISHSEYAKAYNAWLDLDWDRKWKEEWKEALRPTLSTKIPKTV